MGEIVYTKRICAELRAINAMVVPYSASMRNQAGFVDRIVIHRYWSGFLEFKGLNTTIKKHQEITIKQINDRQPATAFVIREPGLIQNHKGETLVEFVTAKEMIACLARLRESAT